MSLDDVVNNNDDFKKMLRTTAFWGLDVIPTCLIAYCSAVSFPALAELNGEEFVEVDFAHDLRNIFMSSPNTTSQDSLVAAIEIGRSEVVEFLSDVVSRDAATTKAATSMVG